jgi:uncharacterized integral membrane protein
LLRRLVTALILIPLAVVIVAFAVANRQTVTVSFDPFDAAAPAYAATMPLFVLIIALLILGVLIGGVAAWLRQGKWRRTARRLDRDMRDLRAEVEGIKCTVPAEAPGLPAPLDLPPPPRVKLRPPVG